MLKILQRLWKEKQRRIQTRPSASVYADDSTLLVIKNKVRTGGPVYLEDSPSQRFKLDQISGIQEFLIDILASPVKEENTDVPPPLRQEFLRRLEVQSQREAIERYVHVSVELIDDVLVVSPSVRHRKTKSWLYKEQTITEKRWDQEDLGARAILKALSASE